MLIALHGRTHGSRLAPKKISFGSWETRPKRQRKIMARDSFNRLFRPALAAWLAAGLAGCATESHKTLEVHKPTAAATAYTGPKNTLVVGKFDNRSSYMRGLFSDGVDRLGGQAKTILIGHLQETGRFTIMDRDNMEEIAREAKLKGQEQALKGDRKS